MAANVIGEVFALWLSAFTGEWIAWRGLGGLFVAPHRKFVNSDNAIIMA